MEGINIIIDESGTMGNNINEPNYSWTKYFVISGYIVDDKGLQSVKSLYLKEELKIKRAQSEYYNKIEEIKGVNIIPEDCAMILKSIINNIKTFIPFSIVVCKRHLLKKVWNENAAFNYFLKLLIRFLRKNGFITSNKINIYVDNRGRKTPFRTELNEYLEQDLYLDSIEEKERIFKIEYKDSKSFSYIRCADLLAYSILKIHTNKTSRDRKFIENLNKYDINLLQNKIVFPETTCKKYECEILKIPDFLIKKIDNVF